MPIADLDAFSGPHVATSHFLRVNNADGTISRYHNGFGDVTVDGHVWSGVTSPYGGQVVSIGLITSPGLGKATAVAIRLSGADLEFWRSMYLHGQTLIGRPAALFEAVFDHETQFPLTPLKLSFPRGTLSAPKIVRGDDGRYIEILLEGPFAARNFAPSRKWNGATQRRRFPNDKGWDLAGLSVQEVLR